MKLPQHLQADSIRPACYFTINLFGEEHMVTYYVDLNNDPQQEANDLAEHVIMDVIKYFAQMQVLLTADGKYTIGVLK